MKLLGAILAGGRSRRFGSDKALAELHGRPMIEHAVDAIRATVAEIVVCGRDAAPGGLVAIADRPAPDLGPLGGLCGALHHAAAHGFDGVLTLPCDTPLLPPGLIDRIASGGACYVRGTPVIGCWPVALAPKLDAYLRADGDRSVRRWAGAVEMAAIDVEGQVPNINHPADLARLVQR